MMDDCTLDAGVHSAFEALIAMQRPHPPYESYRVVVSALWAASGDFRLVSTVGGPRVLELAVDALLDLDTVIQQEVTCGMRVENAGVMTLGEKLAATIRRLVGPKGCGPQRKHEEHERLSKAREKARRHCYLFAIIEIVTWFFWCCMH